MSEGSASISGVVGKITWGWFVAAAIKGYTVTRTKATSEWSVRATVELANPHNMRNAIAELVHPHHARRAPVNFVALHQKGEWHWPIVSMTYNPETQQLDATLAPPVE